MPVDVPAVSCMRQDDAPSLRKGIGLLNHEGLALWSLIRFTAAAREIDSVLPAQCLHVLLLVAAKPGVTHRELETATGLAKASVWRNVTALSGVHRNGKPGLGLVAQVPNRVDARGFSVFLTTKGREAVRRLLQAATGKPADCYSPPTVR